VWHADMVSKQNLWYTANSWALINGLNGTVLQEEVTGTMEEVDYSAHAKRTAEPGGGAGIKQRWKLMDVDRDGRANLQDYLNSLHNWVIN
jgi:hypothetical protein